MANQKQYLDEVNTKRLLDRLTTLDLPAFQRQTIGFDRIFDEFAKATDQLTGAAKQANYPPYNVIRTGEHSYLLELAVAGFDITELDVVVKEDVLTVHATPHLGANETDAWPVYIHKGVAHRAFTREFRLSDGMEVTAAGTANGILTITLEHRIPEEKQPKRIAISANIK